MGWRRAAPVRQVALEAGNAPMWKSLPVLCIVLLGATATNFISVRQQSPVESHRARILRRRGPAADGVAKPPLLRKYLLCALAGITWYFQFFFCTMGESRWALMAFPVGPCTWPASSSSPACGVSR